MTLDDVVLRIVAPLAALLAGGVVHEYGHAVSAKWLGDDTATKAGRLTLNPIPHLDPFMTFILPMLLVYLGMRPFGGMKPVPLDPSKMRHPSWGLLLSALAGPAWQVMFAFGVLAVGLLLSPWLHWNSMGMAFVKWGFAVNIVIAVFNLIPIPPLDGSRVLRHFLPEEGRRVLDQVERFFGLALIFILVVTGALRPILVFVFGIAESLFRFFWYSLSW